jgi:hypothetical protein
MMHGPEAHVKKLSKVWRKSVAGPARLWCVELPKDITEQVVSEANPHGTLTNEDWEMAG